MGVTLDIEEIRAFVAVTRLSSFSRAAESLHRSQPAISRRIELLERKLDVPLFERKRGSVILTDAGATFLPYAETVLAASKDGAEAISALRQGAGGRVSLAVVGTLANASLTGVLSNFRLRHPNVRLDLQTANSQGVADLVFRGDAMLGLRYLTDSRSALTSQVVSIENMKVVCAPSHRLADGRRHSVGDLARERWVAFSSSLTSRESLIDALQRKLLAAGLEDLEITPIDSLSAQKRLVEAGFGIALLAENCVEEELRTGTLKILDVPALNIQIPVTAIYRRNGYLSAAAKSLLGMFMPFGTKPLRKTAAEQKPGMKRRIR
jgi:DNA-binding transcriptional LysR family regulator